RMIIERRQTRKDRRRIGCHREGGRIQTRERRDMLDAWCAKDNVDRSFDNRFRPIEGGAGWQLQHGDEITLVLLGDETCRDACELDARETDQQRVDHEYG